MKTTRHRFVWLLGALFIIGLLLVLLRTPRGPKPGSLSLSIASLTNSATTGLSALFTVSNCNPWTVAFRPGLPQVRSNNLWSPVEITVGDMPCLGPGQCTTFSVAVPLNGEAWRVPVVFCSVDPQLVMIARYRIWTAYQKVVELSGGRPPSQPLSPGDTNFTSEITR